MKKRLSIGFIVILATLVLATTISLAYGYNFSFPFARRSYMNQEYHTGHLAYDYHLTNGETIAAAMGGSVVGSRWVYNDGDHVCDGTANNRGNYIILDHNNNLETWYFHLSRNGNTPGIGAYFYQGQYMALGDDTGCSTGAHLHFATKLADVPFDPYEEGSSDWVSGAPIPMGFRDQNGVVNGPYAINLSKILDLWRGLEGRPGSPIGDDYGFSCTSSGSGPLEVGYRQLFEHGYISYCSSANASYVEYVKTYLPDIRYRNTESAGWNSTIIVRNLGSSPVPVNITIYRSDGSIVDSRTHTSLAPYATWKLYVHDILSDQVIGFESGDFKGTAVVSASATLSVVVENRKGNPALARAYTGISSSVSGTLSPSTFVALPLVYRHPRWGYYSNIKIQNTGDTSANVTIAYRDMNASNPRATTQYLNIPVNGSLLIDMQQMFNWDEFFGTALVYSNQPLAVMAEAFNTAGTIAFDYNAISVGAREFNLPYLMKNYGGWVSCFVVQNLSGNQVTVNGMYSFDLFPYTVPIGPIQLAGYQAQNICQADQWALPNGGHYSAKITASAGDVALAVSQANVGSGQAESYSGVSWTSNIAVLPHIGKNYGWSPSGTWNSGITVQNTSNSSAYVEIRLYNNSGIYQGSIYPAAIAPGRHVLYYLPSTIPGWSNFDGSAEVISLYGQPIVGLGSAICTSGCGGDVSMMYNSVPR